MPFFRPDLLIVLTDPHRPGHERTYYPGEANLHMADVVIINKEKTAKKQDIELVRKNIKKVNSNALIIDANSKIIIRGEEPIRGKRLLIVEDGPTLTHGGMSYGAGYIAAKRYNCKIIDPRPFAVGSIKKTFEKFPHLGKVLPAMGYGKEQMKELEKTINKAKCDVVIIGTPIDLRRLLKINKPAVRIRYELEQIGKPNLEDILKKFLK